MAAFKLKEIKSDEGMWKFLGQVLQRQKYWYVRSGYPATEVSFPSHLRSSRKEIHIKKSALTFLGLLVSFWISAIFPVIMNDCSHLHRWMCQTIKTRSQKSGGWNRKNNKSVIIWRYSLLALFYMLFLFQ